MNKKLVLGLIVVIIIVVGGVIYWQYFQDKEVIVKEGSREEIVTGLTEFYKEDYYSILEKRSTYNCNLQVNVQASEEIISINSDCTVMPPYSAVESFLAVAKGNLEVNGEKVYTGLDWDTDEKEAIKKKFKSISHPLVVSGDEGTVKGETRDLCFLPCVDDSSPISFEILKVSYDPTSEELSNLFVNYSWKNFEDLAVHSIYSYETSYESMEKEIEWRYLLGQFETGKFNLKINFDKPVKSVSCEREKVETLTKIPSTKCKVTKLDKKTFNIKGFSTGLERLIVKL